MYRILACPVGLSETLADFRPDARFSEAWTGASPFVVAPPAPLELTWMPQNETGRRVAFYPHGPVLMSKPLVAALQASGVDNLDIYPVVIKSVTGGRPCHDYQAVNVLGAVAAADMEKSVVLDASDGSLMTVMFDSLVIDPERAFGFSLFRLAENISTIVVHERVVDHLAKCGGFGLTFVDPADFFG